MSSTAGLSTNMTTASRDQAGACAACRAGTAAGAEVGMLWAEATDEILGQGSGAAIYLHCDGRIRRADAHEGRERGEHLPVLHDGRCPGDLVLVCLARVWRWQAPGGGCIIRMSAGLASGPRTMTTM
jgi:hypothetical protein